MAYINYAPMRIVTEDPWTLTELAKAGGLGGGGGGYPHLGNLPLRALVCDGQFFFLIDSKPLHSILLQKKRKKYKQNLPRGK